ncbi:MAG: 4Fe-4S binding protein [Planctomycetota bacterium]|jgi:polyferredoxin
MAEKGKSNNFTAKLLAYRTWAQSALLLLWLDPLSLRLHGICAPVFHCYSCPLATFACPVGVIAGFGALHIFPFAAIAVLIVAGALFGTFLCGFACPFGFLQDLASKVATPRFTLPKWTRHVRYVVLIGTVLAVPYFLGKDHLLYICRICPAGALEGAVPNVVKLAVTGQKIVWPNVLKSTILIVFVLAIFFTHRPWCTVFCPLGAILGLFNRISVFFVRLNPDKCTNCRQCHSLCNYGARANENPNDSHCIRCLNCTKCGPEAITVGSIFSRPKQHEETLLNDDSLGN